MSGYRFDEMTGEWIVVAPSRRGLPMDPTLAAAQAARVTDEAASRFCPFCPGRESETERAVAQITDDAGQWLVRVVANRFPTVRPDATLEPTIAPGIEQAARGHHEVVIESREHALDIADFDEAQAVRVLRTYRDRVRALEREPDTASVSLFRNRGRRSGSSQSHPHAQVVTTTVVPAGFAVRHRRNESFAAEHGRALLDALVERERAGQVRMVEEAAQFDVLCPFASHRAYETWIVPKTARASFAMCDDDEMAALAPVLTRTLLRIRQVTRDAAYNLLVRSAPTQEHTRWSRWYLEIAPRTGGDAGFELLSGMEVVPVAPEIAAAEMRATAKH